MSRRFRTGEKIDNYRINGFIGAGGMGEVYLGIHTQLNRDVAIKVLNMSVLDNSMVIRFQNEARLQSSLHHPNIATLYDFKEVDKRLFIFMEFVNGECLEDLIERRFFSVDETLQIFYSIVKAVAFVHSNGIVHRDIKSQNIKLTSEGVPKLLDFGIAKDTNSSKLTRTGGVIGTPNYLAPEQLGGEQASVQTDIWSLGVLLYEMLTSEMPFQSTNIGELCDKIKNAQYPSIARSNSAVPREVVAISEKCLAKESFARYQTAEELSADIAEILKSKYGLRVSSSQAIKKLFNAEEESENDYSVDKYSSNKTISKSKGKFWIAGFASLFIVVIFFGLLGIWGLSNAETANENTETVNENAETRTPNQSDILFVKKDKPAILLPNEKADSSIKTAKSDIKTASASNNSEQLTVTIDVIESSAEVMRNGQVIGNTPYELSGRIGETIELTLRREGYKEEKIQVEINSRKRVHTYSLQAK